jgi:hypothetical protein
MRPSSAHKKNGDSKMSHRLVVSNSLSSAKTMLGGDGKVVRKKPSQESPHLSAQEQLLL